MAQPTDVVSLDWTKRWFNVGLSDTAADRQYAAAITTASEWLDDRCGPVVQRTVDGDIVGMYASTALAEQTRIGSAAMLIVSWVMQSSMLRVDEAGGFEVPNFTTLAFPEDAVRALLGDAWIDPEVDDATPGDFVGSFRPGIWATP